MSKQNLSMFIKERGEQELKATANGANISKLVRASKQRTAFVPQHEVNFTAFKRDGVSIVASNNNSGQGFIVRFSKRFIAKDEFMSALRKDNPELSFYDEDIDDNGLIAMTDEPLWCVSRKGNAYVLKRNF